jgi:TetR/AcrR family transcriptional regulator, repressor for uid operon
MTLAETIQPFTPAKSAARRDAILDAAKKVFSDKGFDLATVQDVAAACDMSPGNLYRYFTSKAEMVRGLVERDRSQMAGRFAELAASPDQLESFEKLGRAHLRHECEDHARLTLEIWAASSRRPELKELCASMETSIVADLKKFLERLAAEGKLGPKANPDVICHLIMTMAQGMFRDAAIVPNHNIERDLDIMFAVIGAAMAGHINLEKQQTETGKAQQ